MLSNPNPRILLMFAAAVIPTVFFFRLLPGISSPDVYLLSVHRTWDTVHKSPYNQQVSSQCEFWASATFLLQKNQKKTKQTEPDKMRTPSPTVRHNLNKHLTAFPQSSGPSWSQSEGKHNATNTAVQVQQPAEEVCILLAVGWRWLPQLFWVWLFFPLSSIAEVWLSRAQRKEARRTPGEPAN